MDAMLLWLKGVPCSFWRQPSTMRAMAAAAYRLPAPVMWPAVSSSAAMSRSERLRLLTG